MAKKYMPWEYKTISEKRDAEREALSQSSFSEYKRAIRQRKKEQEAMRSAQGSAVKQPDDANFFVRFGQTIGDIAANVIEGASKGLEGIVDMGMGLVGAVGGIFDDDFKERTKNAIAYDWTGETFGNAVQDALQYSFLKEDGIVESVASGIGQMLPSVAVSLIPGAGQVASLGTLGVSAAGSGTESAFNDGAEFYRGLGYGVASGAVEVGTEKLFGGVTKAIHGTGVLDNLIRRGADVADTGVKRIVKSAAKSFLEEGAEEIGAELAQPALKSIYKGREALSEYGSGEYWRGVGEAGVVGGLTALAFAGTVGVGLSKLGIGASGKEADLQASLTKVDELRKKAASIQAEDPRTGKGNGTTDSSKLRSALETVATSARENFIRVEQTLKGIDAETRKKYIDKYNLSSMYDTDGSMTENFRSILDGSSSEVRSSVPASENGERTKNTGRELGYSFGLWGNEAKIERDLDEINAFLDSDNQGSVDFDAELYEDAPGVESDVPGAAVQASLKSREGIEKYTEKEYNSFGWPRVNNVFNSSENSRLRSLFADAVSGQSNPPKNQKGEYMIAIGDSVENKIAYMTGKIDNPVITRVLEIDEFDETKLDELRRETYALERRGIQRKTGGVFNVYSAASFRGSSSEQRSGIQSQRYNDRLGAERGAGSRKASRIKEIRFGEDGEVIDEIRYSLKQNEAIGKQHGRVRVFTGRMSETARENRSRFNKALNALGSISGTDVSFVITEPNDRFNALLKDNTIYIGEEQFENGTWAEALIHEYTHLEEGTEEYNRLRDFLTSDDVLVNDGRGGRIPLKSKAADAVASKGYFTDINEVLSIVERARAGSQLSTRENLAYRIYDQELTAHMTEILLGNERFIHRVVSKDRSLAGKIADRIIDLKEALLHVGDGQATAEARNLRRAEKLYLEAARKVGDSQLERRILARSPEDEEVDFTKGIRLDRKKSTRYISYSKIESNVLRHIKIELDKIYGVEDGIADEMAIEYGDDVYIVDSGKENGTVTFGIRRKKKISDAKLRFEFIRRTNNDSISKGYISDELSSRIRDGLGGDPGRYMRRESRTELQIDLRKSEDNQGRVSDKNADNRRLKFSLKSDQSGENVRTTDGSKTAKNIKKEPLTSINGQEMHVRDFSSQVDAVLNGEDTSTSHLRLMDTPALLQAAGLPDLPILITAKHLKTITSSEGSTKANYHGLDVEVVKKLPEYISDPVMIADSLTRDDSVVIITEATDAENRPIIAAILLNGAGRVDSKHINPNIMTSAYGKDNFQAFLDRIADRGSVIYWNKEKSQDMSVSLGIQFPNAITSLDSNTIIHKAKASVNSEILGKEKNSSKRPQFSLKSRVPGENGSSREKVTMSRGQLAALRANYRGDKVFTLKDVKAALLDIDALKELTPEQRDEIEHTLWRGYNGRLHQEGYDIFTKIMRHKLHTKILQEAHMTDIEMDELDKQIVAALQKIVESGKISIKARLENDTSTEGYRKQVSFWCGEHDRAIERNKLLGRVKYGVERLANMKKGRYVNASEVKNDTFSIAVNELARMNWRGGLVRDQKIREHFDTLNKWYSEKNSLYGGKEGANERFRKDIKDALESLGNKSSGALTNSDLIVAEEVIKYFTHEIETHDTIFKNGKRVDAVPEVKRYIETAIRSKEISAKSGVMRTLMQNRFARMVADPALLMRQADAYLDGFFTEQYEELRRGTIDANILERELSADFEKFWGENKSYAKRYNHATLKFDGVDIPLQEAISLVMTMKREHSFSGLAYAGFEIDGKDVRQTISDGFVEEVEKNKTELYKALAPEVLLTLTEEQRTELDRRALEETVKQKRKTLEEQFTDKDRELISLMEKGFEKCREIKVKIDNILQGYSNVVDGYYFPIKRTGLAEHVDMMSAFEGDRVSSLSMNKETVKNAHALFIEPVHVVFMRHLKATSLYSGIGVFTDNLNRLYNLDISRATEIKNAANGAVDALDLSMDNELSARIEGLHGAQRYKVIAAYIYEQLGTGEIELLDGRVAIVDKRDAMHIANKAAAKKATQIAHIKELAKKAELYAQDLKVVHDKFDAFYYYKINVCYDGDVFPVYLNIGRAKNNGKLHIYDITNKIRDTADRINGLERPIGNALTNGIPKNSIPKNEPYVNSDSKKSIFNTPQTLRDTLGKSTKFMQEMFSYFKEMKTDVEGTSKKRSSEKIYNDIVRYVRSTYATFQLGANPKVWVTQLSSLLAASNILGVDCIIKGFGGGGTDVDDYCKLAWLRNNDNSAAMAQVVETPKNVVQRFGRSALQKVRDISMVLIGKVDRFVIKRLFRACQAQVEKNGVAKIGTEENKIEAGKLLTRVILETQQNSLATERSAAMRSGDELLKGFTMFSADAMKGSARFVDAYGALSSLRHQLKDAKEHGSGADIEHLESKKKRAILQCVRSTVALVSVAIFNALIAYGFSWLFRRDEDENIGSFMLDTVGNMLGGIPIIRDVWSFFTNGFEVDNFLLGTINDVIGTVAASCSLVTDAISGKNVTRQEAFATMRKVLYAAGQLAGVPVRNVYNVTTGMLNRVSPSTGYNVESWFYKQAYASDLKQAIEKDDERLTATIAELMLDESVGVYENSSTRTALKDLVLKGYSVLPNAIGETITYEGEEHELDKTEREAFEKIYSISSEAVEDLISLSQYKSASDDVKAAAIRFIYRIYYNLALQNFLGKDLESKTVLFAEAISIEKLAIIIATARSIEGDTDDSGKTLPGSKKAKIENYINSLSLTADEKHMIMGYLGYKNAKGEEKVRSYIQSLRLTKSEREKLLQYSGY